MITSLCRRARRAALIIVGVVAGALVPLALAPGLSSAATLAEPWTPFTNCPVDDPEMIGNPATVFGTICVASTSPSGTFTIGDTTVETGKTELQFGIYGAPDASEGTIVPATDGKTLQSETVTIPGGLLQIQLPESPGDDPLGLGKTLNRVVSGPPLDVKATVEPAGVPSDFNVNGAFGPGPPIVTLPVKIRLQNLLLGNTCYIGSNQNPIVLQPRTLTRPTDIGGTPDPNGFSVFVISLKGSTQGDDSFAVPKAKGCGPLGLLDAAVNSQLGLPSPAGANELVLNDAIATTAIAQAGGEELAAAWHASVVAP